MSDRRHIVTDKSLQGSLDYLRDNAEEIGKARERLIMAAHMVKHVHALEMKKSSEKAADNKKADAYASQAYLDACLEEAKAAGAFEVFKSMREAAALRIEAWRSEQANFRALKI